MKETTPSPFAQLVQAARPWYLLAGILMYSLGVGIADFLGNPIDWAAYWIGQAMITLLQVSSYYLNAYYEALEDPVQRNRGEKNNGRENSPVPARYFLQIALSALSVGAVLTFLLILRMGINFPALIMLGIGFGLAFFYSVPPIRLVNSGYGELIEALFVANITPALGLLFQTGDFHRLLLMLTFPLTALYLAMKVGLTLPHYSEYLRRQQDRLITRAGWQRGMNMHNLLILIAYLLVGISALLGLPWVLTWPGLLTVPVGLYQILRMTQIANGSPPRWRSFSFLSAALFAIAAYVITLSLWTG